MIRVQGGYPFVIYNVYMLQSSITYGSGASVPCVLIVEEDSNLVHLLHMHRIKQLWGTRREKNVRVNMIWV